MYRAVNEYVDPLVAISKRKNRLLPTSRFITRVRQLPTGSPRCIVAAHRAGPRTCVCLQRSSFRGCKRTKTPVEGHVDYCAWVRARGAEYTPGWTNIVGQL